MTGFDCFFLGRLLRKRGSFNVLLRKKGRALTIAQLYLMSMDSEVSYMKKRSSSLGFREDGST